MPTEQFTKAVADEVGRYHYAIQPELRAGGVSFNVVELVTDSVGAPGTNNIRTIRKEIEGSEDRALARVVKMKAERTHITVMMEKYGGMVL